MLFYIFIVYIVIFLYIVICHKVLRATDLRVRKQGSIIELNIILLPNIVFISREFLDADYSVIFGVDKSKLQQTDPVKSPDGNPVWNCKGDMCANYVNFHLSYFLLWKFMHRIFRA